MLSKKKRLVTLSVVEAVFCLLASCSSIDCPTNTLVQTKYQFCSSAGEELTLLDTLSVVTTLKDGSDRIIYNKGVNISSFSLPISYSNPEDKLVFRFKGDSLTQIDTLWVKKNDIPHFESVDCNASFYHELTSIRHTHNCLDSVVIVNPSVTNDDKIVHVYLYPKVSD